MESPEAGLYPALAAEFDAADEFHDRRGGVDLTYVTGEAVIRRLNAVLGPDGWSFKVLDHGIHEQADEVWVLAELMAAFAGPGLRLDAGTQPAAPGRTVVVRQQFGSQKVKRARADGRPLDIGFDLKGATTDALKKCATLLGVGLYLSRKEQQGFRDGEPPPQHRAAPVDGAPQRGGVALQPGGPPPADDGGGGIRCREAGCAALLQPVDFRGGERWEAPVLANKGVEKFKLALCWPHFKARLDAQAGGRGTAGGGTAGGGTAA